ncbi:MAG: phospholipase [Ktedonobacterales bacterium]
MSETHTLRLHTEPVVLDIGQDTGGLVIYTRPEFVGVEIEISPRGDGSQRTHTDVAERQVRDRTICAAVYLPMPAGEYDVWGPDPGQPTPCVIVAGTVTQLDWR